MFNWNSAARTLCGFSNCTGILCNQSLWSLISCWCLGLRGENTCLLPNSCFLASGLQCKNILSKKHKLCSIAHFWWPRSLRNGYSESWHSLWLAYRLGWPGPPVPLQQDHMSASAGQCTSNNSSAQQPCKLQQTSPFWSVTLVLKQRLSNWAAPCPLQKLFPIAHLWQTSSPWPWGQTSFC